MSALARVVAVLGPPAVGKTSLTRLYGQREEAGVFRLREHVPETVGVTVSDPMRPGWFDGYTALASLHDYIEEVAQADVIYSVLLDNFPGTRTQVGLFLPLMRQVAPTAVVSAVELVADVAVLWSRASGRLVCQSCERDPSGNPHLPANASGSDPDACAQCGHRLTRREDDSPAGYLARLLRYHNLADGVRGAFTQAGIPVPQLNGGDPLDVVEQQFRSLLNPQGSDPP